MQAVNNLATRKMELLNTHSRLGHYDIHKFQKLFKRDEQYNSILSTICLQAATCKVTLCMSCILGKARMQSFGSKISVDNVDHTNVIKVNDLDPDVRVSTYQYVCQIKGRLSYTRGREDPKEMYSGGTSFVDHGSGSIRN